MTRITNLRELGTAWQDAERERMAAENRDAAIRADAEEERERQRGIRRAARSPLTVSELNAARPPWGDIPLCADGKVPYDTKAEAQRLYPNQKTYRCELGHPHYHTKSRGRSSRERGFRRLG